ncbi:hypothetical protein ACFFLM_20525 [Deinococcus oregonensis]|uniref:Uncharacterized protein n=1 Tax=Deinococcus oregonensis TaxID=1805970 RepID=A0ABV6B3J9_9DEIO
MSKISLPFVLACAATLTSFAHAQTTQAAKPTNLNVDGKAAAALTVGGKTYVSVDALKNAGVTVQKGGIFIRTYPNETPIRLEGCVGEWLNNGAVRIRLTAVTFSNTAMRGAWGISAEGDRVSKDLGNQYQTLKGIQIKFSDNQSLTFSDPLQSNFSLNFYGSGLSKYLKFSSFRANENYKESPEILPIALKIPSIKVYGKTYPEMTFDLTCKK